MSRARRSVNQANNVDRAKPASAASSTWPAGWGELVGSGAGGVASERASVSLHVPGVSGSAGLCVGSPVRGSALAARVLGLVLAAGALAARPPAALADEPTGGTAPTVAERERDERAEREQTEQAVARAMDLSRAFERVADLAGPAVVHVSVSRGPDRDEAEAMDEREEFFRFFGPMPGMPQPRERAPQPRASVGSGVIVSPEGYILTNNHVVEGAGVVTVKLEDNATYTAKIVGTDPATDVAVLKIEGENFRHVPLGDSDELRRGEWVIAIGSPFGLTQTVTAGIVSAKGRVQTEGDLRDVQFQDFIQTDAAINPGNSGGPLLDLEGRVVGINSAILSRAGGNVGIGFAIPSNLARSVMESLIRSGRVERGWMGVGIQDLDADLAKSFGYQGTEGVLITEVTPQGPAERAGLKQGDIVTRLNGRALRNSNALRNAVAALAPGSTASVDVVREGQRETVSVTVGSRDEALAAGAGPGGGETATSPTDGGLGVTVQTVTEEIARELRDPRARGVVIRELERRGTAARAGLRAGDVIFAVNRRAVTDAATFRQVMAEVDVRAGVQLGVRRGGQSTFLFFREGR